MEEAAKEVRDLVEIAVLGEGVLAEADEHRIVKVALSRGLGPREAKLAIDEALARVGGRRAVAAKPGPDAPAPPARTDAPAEAPPRASDEAVQKVISRRFGRRSSASQRALEPAPPPPPPPRPKPKPLTESNEEPVVAELVVPAEQLPAGTCTACLAVVARADVAEGRAELRGDRVHCRACLAKLRAGLLCGECYGPLAREDFVAQRAAVRGDRAQHVRCPGSGRA